MQTMREFIAWQVFRLKKGIRRWIGAVDYEEAEALKRENRRRIAEIAELSEILNIQLLHKTSGKKVG